MALSLRQTIVMLVLVTLLTIFTFTCQSVDAQRGSTAPAPPASSDSSSSSSDNPPAPSTGKSPSPPPAQAPSPSPAPAPSSPRSPPSTTGGKAPPPSAEKPAASPVPSPTDSSDSASKVVTSELPAKTVVADQPESKDSPSPSSNSVSSSGASGEQTDGSAKASSSGTTISPWLIGLAVCGGIVVICISLAAYSRWTRKGRRNRRFEDIQFSSDENNFGAGPLPYGHRAGADPFKQNLGAHHRGAYP